MSIYDTPGELVTPDLGYMPTLLDRQSAAISQTIPRLMIAGDQNPLVTTQLFLFSIWLIAGRPISNITFCSGTTAADTPVNQWFGLWSAARAKLATTVDHLTGAWAANTEKTLALSSSYTPPQTVQGYVGIMVKATTPPTLAGLALQNAVAAGRVPILGGSSTTGLAGVATAPATAAAITAGTIMPYAYLS